jgi:hypothetical protein
MIFETQQDRDYAADDRDRLWNAFPRPCGEVRIPMPTTINLAWWKLLIDEDVAWLDQQGRTLEREHIRMVLLWGRSHKVAFDDERKRDDILAEKDRQIESLQAELRQANSREGRLKALLQEWQERALVATRDKDDTPDLREPTAAAVGHPQSPAEAKANHTEGSDNQGEQT